MGCNCVIGKIEEEIDDQRVQQISKLIKKSLYIKNSESNQKQSKINKKHNKIPKYIKRLFKKKRSQPIFIPRKKHFNTKCIFNEICHRGKFKNNRRRNIKLIREIPPSQRRCPRRVKTECGIREPSNILRRVGQKRQ